MSKETAFYGSLRAMTDQWTDLFGYFAPAVVTDTQREYRAVREAAGLMDFSMLRKVDLDGAGALQLVDSIVCRDVSTLKPGRIAYGPLCDPDGKMVDDCTVMARTSDGDRVRFCGANDRDYEIFSAAAAGLGIEVRERTDELPHLCLQGPKSRAILQNMTTIDLSSQAFPYYTFQEDVEVAGIPVFMTRLGYTAELGYELWVDRDRALDLWDALLAEGANHGLEVIGMDALDLFRIEGGFIIGGVEYDPTVSPYECGLGWAVDLHKPEFQGRHALETAEQASALRLTSVALEAGGAEATGAELTIDASVVGFITQAVVSPYLDGKTLGLAKVDKRWTDPGTTIEARVAGEPVSGRIVQHPAYDPERRRVKG
jgi:aminomethyltransferase